jgi:hypothetical protein
LQNPADAQDSNAGGEWKKVGSSEGITVYRKEVPGDPVFAYKGEGTLEAPAGKLISVARDIPRQPEWVNRLEEARVLREVGPNHRIIYLKVDSPWPVSDRDFVIESKLVIDAKRKSARFENRSVEDSLAPPNKCCVRGVVHRNQINLEMIDAGRTGISAEAHVDPRGSLPAWLVNKVQQTFPRKTIAGLLRQVAKPDIVDYFTRP